MYNISTWGNLSNLPSSQIAHEFEAHPEDESTCDGGWRVLSQDEFRLVKAKEAKQAPDHRRYNEPQPFLKRPRPVKIGPVGDDE